MVARRMQYAAATITAEGPEGLEKGVETYLERIEPSWELITVSHSGFVERPATPNGPDPAIVRYSALIITGRPQEDS